MNHIVKQECLMPKLKGSNDQMLHVRIRSFYTSSKFK